MENSEKIVDFDKFCKTCKRENEPETNDICAECLENPVNIDSRKPVKWERKEANLKGYLR